MKVSISVPGKFYAFDLARQLNKRGYLDRLFTTYPKYKTSDYVPDSLVSSIMAPEIAFRAWRKLPPLLKRAYNPHAFISDWYDGVVSKKLGSCDVCSAFSGYALNTFRRAKILGAKTVLERGSSHIEYQTAILKEEYNLCHAEIQPVHPKIIEKELHEYNSADYISIPSHFVKRTFLEKGVPEEKLIHVPYGVDLSRFTQIPKEDDVFRVVAAGMSVRKGVHYLLQAFSELRLPNSELLLIGDVEDALVPFFKKYEGTYKHIGRKPYEELYRYYSSGSVFAMMSLEEGLAMVQIQAMACGLPVIATTNTGAEDIVREGKDGFVIPIRDVEAMKEKLLFLYEHPDLRAEMGKSAKSNVLEGFTWEDYGNRIVSEYERITKK